MRPPVSFDDVWYFRREYRGDLVVTDGVLYYFPHTNRTLEKARQGAPDPVDGVTPSLGAAGSARVSGLSYDRGLKGRTAFDKRGARACYIAV